MPIEKAILSVAGELAVAAELCRRNIYAQLTLGNQKRTDLLVFADTAKSKRFLRIEVKAKQGRTWPNQKGISGDDVFLVLVDFCGLKENERPKFFVLSVNDWTDLIQKARKEYLRKHPDRRVIIEDNCLVALDERNARGQPYRGHSVTTSDVKIHEDAWPKIVDYLGMLNAVKRSIRHQKSHLARGSITTARTSRPEMRRDRDGENT
jgi:hypothetical protein